MTTSPPKIMDGRIELFGHKGKEIYRVKRISFYDCKYMDGRCVHDIFMVYEDNFSSYCFHIEDVSYEDLVRKNYIAYFKKSNMKMLELSCCPNCKLLNHMSPLINIVSSQK